MNAKKRLILIILLFALVLIGGVIAYQKLGSGLSGGTLMTETPSETEGLSGGDNVTLDSSSQETNSSSPETENVSSIAPDFTVYNADGEAVTLHSFFGKPIVLNFWSSACPPCQSEMPEFQEVFEEQGEEIQFLMIDCVGTYIGGKIETLESGQSYVEEQGFTFPVYFDTTQNAIQTYGISSFPTTFFLDADGNLVTYGMGALNKATLEKGISMIRETTSN